MSGEGDNAFQVKLREHGEGETMMKYNIARFHEARRKIRNGTARALAITLVVAGSLLFVPATKAQNSGGNNAFGFNSNDISGFPTGHATLTGGGAFNLATGFVNSSGGFGCTADVNQGPLFGCKAGEGVRWDTASLLTSTTFKCTGAAGEALKTANTSLGNTNPDTVVLLADFYRAGDGNDESFTARMIVSTGDLAPEIQGTQNVWIQGVGCGSAIVNFNH
jgi:hypothetical protein